MKLTLYLFTIFMLGLVSAARYSRTVSYEGDIVIRCDLEDKRMMDLLSNDRVDVWKVTADHADIRLKKKLFHRISEDFPGCTVLHSDVESLVQEFERGMEMLKLNDSLEWFDEYHTYDEIVTWYSELKSDDPSIIVNYEIFAESLEKRSQPAIHITKWDASPKYKIYFQCQIHAREWISGATCMYIADYIVNGNSERVKKLLDDVVFIFVPLVNPDGYEYTWNGDRLWRKNRRVNSGSSCRGVDLNRNYNDHWAQGGSSNNPCSETYHGASAASEPETQNTQDYFKFQKDIIGAIDWHSYSQLILRPWGWTSEDSPDEAQLKEIGDKMEEAIREVHGKTYTSQKSIGLYPTTGSADDWFYGEDASSTNGGYRAAGFTVELRDTGFYGFLLPPDQIKPTGEENVASVLTFAEALVEKPLIYNPSSD